MSFTNYEMQDFVATLSKRDQELFEERAAIIEYDGEIDRDWAEIKAKRDYYYQKHIQSGRIKDDQSHTSSSD